MSGKLQVTIPTPCHEDWNKMTPAEKGRYCASCEKIVMDFTSMSDAQIIAYFKKENKSTCGHFHKDQLDRYMLPARKRLPWVRYFFQIAIPALLFSSRAIAQGEPRVVKDTTQLLKPVIRGRVAIPKENRKISGQVTDLNGAAIPFASLIWNATKRGVQADAEGRFVIDKNEKENRLTISSVGFYSQTIDVGEKDNYTIQLVTWEGTLEGETVIIRSKPKKAIKEIPLLKRIFTDTLTSKFIVYPNPAAAGSTITVEWKKEEGEYNWELTDVAGRLVTTGKVVVSNKIRIYQIELPGAPSGTYILTFLGKNAKSYSEKIIIK